MAKKTTTETPDQIVCKSCGRGLSDTDYVYVTQWGKRLCRACLYKDLASKSDDKFAEAMWGGLVGVYKADELKKGLSPK